MYNINFIKSSHLINLPGNDHLPSYTVAMENMIYI